MKEQILFSIDTPYRQPLPVKGWLFGNESKKSLAIVGALRGNEVQQMFICSRLIQRLKQLEDRIRPDAGILIVPCANQFSMNVGKRFWAADNTDINRMFPGYNEGETTQRIADRIFRAVQGFSYGIQLATIYLPGLCTPNVRIMHTGYEEPLEGLDFGLPYVAIRDPQPYDTTTLNYNWQIWNTHAFSLYASAKEEVSEESAEQMVNSILHFMACKGMLDVDIQPLCEHPRVFRESSLKNILNSCGGLMLKRRKLGEHVCAGDVLAEIMDPMEGSLLEALTAPCDGVVFYYHGANLIAGHEVACRILRDDSV